MDCIVAVFGGWIGRMRETGRNILAMDGPRSVGSATDVGNCTEVISVGQTVVRPPAPHLNRLIYFQEHARKVCHVPTMSHHNHHHHHHHHPSQGFEEWGEEEQQQQQYPDTAYSPPPQQPPPRVYYSP